MAWRLNSFFGCGKLETGGVVIGIIQLILSVISIVVSILGITAGQTIINDSKTSPEDISTAKSNLLKIYFLK